ncbi:uncharacterized protein [Penaeus vannamei]|uniref:uncharacterized protein n=1 Tax=Penaeus vannamei TaxID=6689 RepID=UPI00387F9A25
MNGSGKTPSKQLADVLEEALQKEGGVLHGASLLRAKPSAWYVLLKAPFADAKTMLLNAEKQSFIVHICCTKRKSPYVSKKRNAHMDKLRNVCFKRIKTIMESAKINGAPVTAATTWNSLELTVRIDRQCTSVCLVLCFPVHRNSLVATCPHSATRKRTIAEVSSSVTYFTAAWKGAQVFCKKAELPMKMQRSAGGVSEPVPRHLNDFFAKLIPHRVDAGVKQNVKRNAENDFFAKLIPHRVDAGVKQNVKRNAENDFFAKLIPHRVDAAGGVSEPVPRHLNDVVAKLILDRVDAGVKQTVKRNAETVCDFADRLQKTFHNQNFLAGADVMHSGSAYEGLSVKPKTDFDVIVVLALKCLEDDFEVIRDESLFFKIKTKTGFVDAEKLQELLFKELAECVEKTKVEGARVRCREGLASLDVEIETALGKISVDLSPQIPVRSWGRCPDLVSLSDLPRCLRRYIDVLNRNKSPVMFFSPAVPGRHRNGHLLCNVSFSMLEKSFLRDNVQVRDMVRLAKATAVCQDWKEKFGLKSFHIKRVAVKYSDELEGKALWSGYQLLLSKLLEELASTDTFDGFFISNQVIYKKKPEKVNMLKKKIKQVIPWRALTLRKKWDEYARQA